MIKLIDWKLFNVLNFINDNPKTNFTKIKDHFKANPTTVNLWLKHFMHNDHITIKASKNDKRINDFFITPKGKKTIIGLKMIHKENV